jgi:hypothetical protein
LIRRQFAPRDLGQDLLVEREIRNRLRSRWFLSSAASAAAPDPT